MAEIAKVACNGCTACCRNELLILHPEMGDDPATYETQAVTHPLTGKPAVALQQRPNGDCIYLGDDGCTIWGRHPAICREFSCVAQYLSMTRKGRRKLVALGLFSRPVFEAARKRARAA